MEIKSASDSRNLARSIAMGVLLSILVFYGIHVLGTWEIENSRPDPETTSTLLLHNKCAVLGKEHILSPNTGITAISEGIDGTKLAASFMNFFDGHIIPMVIFSLLLGGLIFAFRTRMKKK